MVDHDAQAQFTHVVTSLKAKHPRLAYIHLLEPRFAKGFDTSLVSTDEKNDYIRDIWAPRPIISSGGFTLESAIERADTTGDLVAFGRYFISNVSPGPLSCTAYNLPNDFYLQPDLVYKLKNNVPLTQYNRSTFYLPGETASTGYTDYPFHEAEEVVAAA